MRSSFKAFLVNFSIKETIITLSVLFAGLLITIISVHYSRMNMKKSAEQDFQFTCSEVAIKIETRLDEHAQLLRSGAGLFTASDTVTREEWRKFNDVTKLSKYLPGIEGFGYSIIISPGMLSEHIRSFRENGFPQYDVYPKGKREIYTSIIYLEPFSGRNLRAFGYDMFSEPVRRKAMQTAIDSNNAILSGKVILMQEGGEPGEDQQPGVLMYVPVYKTGMEINTVEERHAAIKGWVYSPYRMKDLMKGIRAGIDSTIEEKIRFWIYDDDEISEKALLYDSNPSDQFKPVKSEFSLLMPIIFNGRRWTISFTSGEETSIFQTSQLVILISGIIISLLLFLLSAMQITANIRSSQIKQLNSQLEKLNNDKDRFIAVLSHDLKSPFTSILGFLELLIDDIRHFTIDEIVNHLSIINDAAKNFYNLLEDLLMWTRAHSGKIPFNPRRLSFRAIYDNIMEILLPLAESKSISISYSGEENLNIYADADMLKAILRNLVSNAIKFTHKGGTVKISAGIKDGNVLISVADTGVGIKPDHLDRLFDISKVQSTSGTSNEKGSGLGLVLCKEFIEKHGGEMEVISLYGKGTDFRFTLPMRDE